MQCPVDGEALVMADRSGVEIDYCPKCRGVWLDRSELDKIIERAAAPVTGHSDDPRNRERDRYRDHEREDDRSRRPYGKKRESFLGEIFDF